MIRAQKKGLRQQPLGKPHLHITKQAKQVAGNTTDWLAAIKGGVLLRRSGETARPWFRRVGGVGGCTISGVAAVGGGLRLDGVACGSMLDQSPRRLQSFAPQSQTAAGFASPIAKGSSNAALPHRNGGIFYAQNTALPVGGSDARGFMPAGFLLRRSCNSHSARLFRLQAKSAGTSAEGASL